MQRLNENLAYELGNTLDELDAFKRTVVDSKSLISKEYISQEKEDSDEQYMMPSFLRVMQAEQNLVDNYIYESEPSQTRKGGVPIRKNEESFEQVDENSIP